MECNCNNNNNRAVIPWVRGNRLPLVICVYEDVVTQEGEGSLVHNKMERVPYEIQAADTVTVVMKSGFRQVEMPFTTEGNKVLVTDNGELAAGTYTVEVTIVRGDGARGRWQETRQVRVYENTSDAQLGEMYAIEADLFFWAKGDTGNGIADITSNPDDTLTITMTDGTTYTTQAMKGDKGDKGDQGEKGTSIVSFDVTGQTDTSVIYTVTFSDDTTEEVAVPKGPQGDTGLTGNGIASTTLNSDYTLTIAYTDGTTYTTPSIRGAQGVQGVSIIAFTQTGETATNTLYNVVFSDGRTQSVAIPKGVKGDKGDTGNPGSQGAQGPKGDTVTATDYTLYNVQGSDSQGAMSQDATTKAISAQTGYYTCGTAAGTAAKVVTVESGNLYKRTLGGHFKVKMTNKNTAASGVTLQVGSETATTLWYNGAAASADNSWEDGEVISVYFDGTNYQASNSQGGGGKAEKIKYDSSQSGLASDNVQGALDEVGIVKAAVTINEESVQFVSGQGIDGTSGIIVANADAKRTDYIKIGRLKERDTIVWGGTAKDKVLALYDHDHKFLTVYSGTGTSRTITVSAATAALDVAYARITFSANGTPVFTINGKNILNQTSYELALDEDLDKHLPAEGIAVGERMGGVESAINDTMVVTSGNPTLKNGYIINVKGEETATEGWSCTDYIKIPTLKDGDSLYWSGITKNPSATIAFYDKFKHLITTYSASYSSRTIELTDSSAVVINDAQYIRASFSGSPVLTLNGNTLFTKHKVATDSTMILDMPANAKGVGEYVRGIMGVSCFHDGYYIDTNGNEKENASWCYATYRLKEAVKAGDVVVWNGITQLTDATISFYRSDGTHIGGWSANGASRTFTIGDSSPTIGSTIIKASFLLSEKDSAYVSINGVVQEFSIIKEDKSVVEYNADKQPMVVSLSRTKTGVSTLKKYFCFAQITDTHGENDLVQRAVDFVNSEVFGSSIDCLVHTGDIQFSSFKNGDMLAFHNAMDNSGKPAFTVLGNHDVYGSTTKSELYERFMKPMVDKGLLVAGTNIDAANYATWYYYDWTDYGVRMIMLNDFDPLYDGYTKPLNTTAYSPSQINFLISTLQSVPSGYTVIIVDHFPPNKGTGYSGTTINPDWTMDVSPIGGGHSSLFTDHQSPVIDILSAYKSKTSLVQSYTYSNSSVASHYGSVDVNVDFTSANGILAFMACGHSHNDEVYKFADKNDIIAIDMLGGVNPTIIDSQTKILRTYSGKAHDAINVYCVRTDERKVYVIRIGADFRNDGKEQVITSFEY